MKCILILLAILLICLPMLAHRGGNIIGEWIPTAEAKIREVQLDMIPVHKVQSIDLVRALTPGMEAHLDRCFFIQRPVCQRY